DQNRTDRSDLGKRFEHVLEHRNDELAPLICRQNAGQPLFCVAQRLDGNDDWNGRASHRKASPSVDWARFADVRSRSQNSRQALASSTLSSSARITVLTVRVGTPSLGSRCASLTSRTNPSITPR